MKYDVVPCNRWSITEFIEYWHYSHSINGIKSSYCFELLDKGGLIGAAIWGKLGMNVWKKYADKEDQLLELRRLCCIDDTPKNTESYFIGKMIRWLRNNTKLKTLISYADLSHGHTGIIYKASNWKLIGQTPPGRVIMFGKKMYHDKTIRTKYKGKLKPFAQKVKDALDDGKAHYTKTLGKNIYLYQLRHEW